MGLASSAAGQETGRAAVPGNGAARRATGKEAEPGNDVDGQGIGRAVPETFSAGLATGTEGRAVSLAGLGRCTGELESDVAERENGAGKGESGDALERKRSKRRITRLLQERRNVPRLQESHHLAICLQPTARASSAYNSETLFEHP